MPRPAKGARLWLRRARVDRRTGGRVANSAWFIKDGDDCIPTGCAPSEIGDAEAKLSAYIAAKYSPERRVRDIEQIDVADVLSVYDEDRRESQANKPKFDERLTRLASWWGGMTLSEVTGANCRAYTDSRPSPGGARRDLEDLRAAINHHAKEGLHRGLVRVWLPEKGIPRDRWLTRSEAAKLIWYCWRAREEQRRWRGPSMGRTLPTSKRPLRHVARFILLALYTGSRAAAVAAASPTRAEGRSWVDLERGVFYRLAEGKKATAKRQPPVRLPPHLLAHLRRWHALGIATTHFVEWNGKPVQSVRTGFATAVAGAKLAGKVTPHTLRHTAATWLMQNGVSMWEAAGFLGMSKEILEKTYGHHHPDHMKAAALGFRKRFGSGTGGDNGGDGRRAKT
jgi:integrase